MTSLKRICELSPDYKEGELENMFDFFNIYPPNPEEKFDNVKNVEIIGNYVTITFTYLSMIVSEGYLIDFLDEMLHET